MLSGTYGRDANNVPIVTDGLVSTVTKVLNGNNTTVAVPLFTVKGMVHVKAIYGVVTTALGANVTAAAWRLNDQTAQSDITLSTGTTLSGVAAGSGIVKKNISSSALALQNNSSGHISEPTTGENMYFSPFLALAKNGATTNIEFVYTTTDTPTSGAIQFFLIWLPLSADADIKTV